MMFKGSCGSCSQDSMTAYSDKVRGGVEVHASDGEFDSAWMCLACAKRLAQKLSKAIDTCRTNMRAGKEYRNDRWQKKQPTAKKKQ